jgi:hypothetical protein
MLRVLFRNGLYFHRELLTKRGVDGVAVAKGLFGQPGLWAKSFGKRPLYDFLN